MGQRDAHESASSAGALRAAAEERIREYKVLRTAKHFSGAMYTGRLAVELLLKCLVCKSVGQENLHVKMHVHDLEVLLYFSGKAKALRSDHARRLSFERLAGAEEQWNRLRYDDPKTFAVVHTVWDDWLFNGKKGIIDWLKEALDE